MAGAYCKFCDNRCFVYRIVPGSHVTHLATCAEGKAFDREQLGVDADTAINPAAQTPVIICETDSRSCTCRAPVDTPAGMHHADCPTNPESRMTPAEIEEISRASAKMLRELSEQDPS